MNEKEKLSILNDLIMEKIRELVAWHPGENGWHVVISRQHGIKLWSLELRDKDGSLKLRLPPQGGVQGNVFVIYVYGVVDGIHEQIRKCLEA